ncbi:MAG TPA: lipid-binding SYLF domain-containing protein [Gammaproteobacteria bacterium]|jgi:lipid-binding SYLF domain-containing protein|nr:lipid-binding SYLF domain-containing protein [Gammaproteobacteria bacterium]
MLQRNVLIGALVLTVFGSGLALAQDKHQQKEEKQRVELRAHADETLQKLFKEVKGSKQLYDKAVGYAVIRVTKAGFVVSGSGGAGVAVDKATKQTTYMKMGAASAGLTFGAAKFDMVFLFQTKNRFNEFVSGGWDSTAGAKATAGKDSASAASGFFDGQIVYTLSDKGLMASADISGTKYWADEDLNKR